MTPQDQPNQIICDDALASLARHDDNQFDLILTDPPYGIGEAAGKNKSRGKLGASRDYGNHDWDNERPSKEVFDEMLRVSKNQIIFGGNYFADMLPPSSGWIVWDKDNGATDFADCELAWTSFDKAIRRYRFRWQGMLQEHMGKHKEPRYHPTQKPLSVIKWILERYAQPGWTILDPFMGSGTTLRAAKDLGMSATGIDISPEYCEIAKKRLQQGVLL